MDRRIGENRINKNKKKFRPIQILTWWLFWLLFLGIIMMIFFGIIENSVEQRLPSQEWSLPLGALEDTPNDFRKIGHTVGKDRDSIALAYLVDEGIKLVELDYLGRIKRTLNIPMDSSKIRLVTLELVEDNYNIYISDRKVLDRIDVDLESLSLVGEKRVSNNSEQFDTEGTNIIVGDDQRTDIIVDGKILASYDNYEDLKKVRIKAYEGKVYATMDTVHGGDIILIDQENVIKKKLTNVVDQENYGYISDLFIKGDIVTIVSHYFNVTEPAPTLLGAWQLDADNLEEKDFWLWSHPRTTLEPKIVNVSGNEISYVLGMQQRIDENKERVLRFPLEQSGMFTNLSIYKRKESKLVDYTRLTNTRQYPLGYEYIKLDIGDIIVWADKNEEYSDLTLAGKGDSWIEFSQNNYKIGYSSLIKSAIMMFVTTPIWGFIMFILDIGLHWKIFILFSLFLFIYNKLSKEDVEKKDKIALLGTIAFVIGIKFYITAVDNGQLKQYIDLYPTLFGNDTLLGTISIVTSILSIFIYYLWYREHEDTSRLIKSSVFIGIETYFYFFSILVYLQSAMLKIKYMI